LFDFSALPNFYSSITLFKHSAVSLHPATSHLNEALPFIKKLDNSNTAHFSYLSQIYPSGDNLLFKPSLCIIDLTEINLSFLQTLREFIMLAPLNAHIIFDASNLSQSINNIIAKELDYLFKTGFRCRALVACHESRPSISIDRLLLPDSIFQIQDKSYSIYSYLCFEDITYFLCRNNSPAKFLLFVKTS